MGETFPRWGMPEVNFVETDPAKIKAEIITGYEKASGRVLADGDPVRLFLLTIADRIILLQNDLNATAQQNLLTYAQGSLLDALGVWLDVKRLAASPALTTLEFTLSQALKNDYVIPKGYEVTNGVVTFATDTELIIPAGELSGEVAASCTTVGMSGNNYLAGQITTIVEPMAYIESARNITDTSGGAETESDNAFAERIKTATDKFSVAGAEAAYRHHAMSVNSSIVDVGLNSPSPCVVELYPLLIGGNLPTEEILEQVSEYFAADDIIPYTDKVTVKTPDVYEYNINVDYYIAKDDVAKSEAIRSAVATAVEEYRVWQQSKIGRDITPDNLIYAVKAAGTSYIDLSTLSPSTYIEIGANTVAQCTGVTVTYKGASK